MIHCQFETATTPDASLRHVTVGAIAYNTDGKILLVKRSEKYSRPNTYAIPGGFLGRDETTQEATLRELKEETGMTGEIMSLFHVNDNPERPKEDRQNVDFIYLVKAKESSFQENDEVTSVEWCDKDTLPKEEDFAFDHRAVILKFFAYKEKPFELPLIGKI